MKTTMKKAAAYLLALMLVFQIVPALGAVWTSNEVQSETELLEVLRIINESGPYLLKGKTLELYLPEGYEDAVWKSSDNNIASVDQNGIVTANDLGKVTISVESKNGNTSTNITVVAPAEAKANSANQSMTILVNGNKTKTKYDGQPHAIEYSYSSDNDAFDADKVKLLRDAPSRTVAGAMKGDMKPEDFTYEDTGVDVTFIVNDGSVYITPIEATVKANDMTISLDELADLDPEFTETGLVQGETMELSYLYNIPEITAAGEYDIEPYGDETQGGYKVKYESGKLTVTEPETGIRGSYLLGIKKYNALLTAEQNEKEKTRLKAIQYLEAGTGLVQEPSIVSYWKFEKQASGKYYISSNGKYLNINGATAKTSSTAQELIVEELDGGKIAIKNDEEYRLNLKSNSIDNGIQGSVWNKGKQPADNEIFTLYNDTVSAEPFEQELYNMLTMKGHENNYFRLRKTTIVARDARLYTNGTTIKDQYEMEPYDFTNTIIVDDKGEAYVYSDHVLTGDYVSYFTVDFVELRKEAKIHNRTPEWLNDESGWLDGAKATYGSEINNNDTPGFHANYKATLHKGKAAFCNIGLYDGDEEIEQVRTLVGKAADLTAPEKDGYIFNGWNTEKDGSGSAYSNEDLVPAGDMILYAQWSVNEETPVVEIIDGEVHEVNAFSEWPEQQLAFAGARIPLRAEPIGLEGKTYTLQWQYSTDCENWISIPGANDITYTYTLDATTTTYYWRAVAINIKDEE